MAFVCELSTGRSLYLDNVDGKTIVTLSSTSPGQQQQASSTFQTGDWTATPEVYLTSDGAVVKLQAAHGHYIRIHGSSIGVSEALSLAALQQMQMQQTSGVTVSAKAPMPPMQPMQPGEMTMGDMHMSLNPMEMRMGSTKLQMSKTPEADGTATAHRFCSQCGTAVKPTDRFCTNCGHQTNQA